MSYGITDVLKDTITGNVLYVDTQKKQDRLNICRKCESLIKPVIFNNTTGTCGVCGCFVDSKVLYEKSGCPNRKW